MMYDFKKWHYNSAEKQAVIEEAMKAVVALLLQVNGVVGLLRWCIQLHSKDVATYLMHEDVCA